MAMLVVLIKKEIAGNVLSFRFVLTFALFLGLILVSLFILASDYQARMQGYEASKAAHREALARIEKIEGKDQQVRELLYNQGVYADRPPQPLEIFVHGLEAYLPAQVHTARFTARRIDEDFYQNAFFSLFATPDCGYLINIVVSLLALLFVFDAICGEKESGTLKLVLANSVPRDLVILSKWIGGYICLVAPFLASLVAGLAYLRLSGAVPLSGATLERLLWLVGVSLLYISLFFTLGLMISTMAHKASTALLVALFAWIGWLLVIPNLAPVIARLVSPVPTLQKINAEKAAVDQEMLLRMQRVSRTMLGYGRKAEEAREKIQQEGEARKRRLDKFYEDELRRQIDLSKTLSRLSPSASFRYAATELARTGLGLFAGFKRAYARFQEAFRQYADALEERRNKDQLTDDWLQDEEIPRLQILEARLGDTLDAIYVDLLLMGVYNVLFFMGAYAFFLRYDVT
jgi:ABC-type transport system involved in multi-copper enzyme maturation permease subunit